MRAVTRVLCTVLLCNACFVFSHAAYAKVRVTERVKYYTVGGNSGEEIMKNMIRKGPKISGLAKNALAIAEIEIEPTNLKIGLKNRRCRISNVDVRVNVKYTLPKWRGSNRASRATRNAWTRFIKTVRWHEKQHTKIAQDHANQLQRAILRLRPTSSRRCSADSFRISSKVRRMERQHRKRQIAFDKKDLGRGGAGVRRK